MNLKINNINNLNNSQVIKNQYKIMVVVILTFQNIKLFHKWRNIIIK